MDLVEILAEVYWRKVYLHVWRSPTEALTAWAEVVGAYPKLAEQFREAARESLAAIEAAGFAVAPVEPTEAMLNEGKFIRMTKPKMEWSVADVYREMLAARPKVKP